MSGEAKSIVLAARPRGAPAPGDFRLETGPVPSPGKGEMLLRAIWLSLDPYMRGRMDDAKSYAPPVEIGGVMPGACVAEVMESDVAGFAAGDIVVGQMGWTTHALSDGAGLRKVDPAAAPLSTALGVLGMPGHTAWVGLNDIARAQPGETILVSAATGAVGSLVGQLARQKGLRVIGVAGGAGKCAYAVEELGFDACLDHRAAADAATLAAELARAAPDGVDIYWDNVGAKTLQAAFAALNTHGRIVLCGMIGWFSGKGADSAMALSAAWRTILTKRLRVEGFIIFDHHDRLPPFLDEVAPMVRDGRIRWRESVAEGLDSAPSAFMAMLDGGNFGKQLVRVGNDPG